MSKYDRTCFWCSCPLSLSKRTREHLVPQHMKDQHPRRYNERIWYDDPKGNVVYACADCNHRRGRLQAVGINAMRSLLTPGWNVEHARQVLKPRAEHYRAELLYWIAIEIWKLGWTPTGKLYDWNTLSHLCGTNIKPMGRQVNREIKRLKGMVPA